MGLPKEANKRDFSLFLKSLLKNQLSKNRSFMAMSSLQTYLVLFLWLNKTYVNA